MSSNFLLRPFRWLFSNNISDLIKRPSDENMKLYKLLIFSLDGVLIDKMNSKVLPLAVETFNKLKSIGYRMCIITNECRYSPKRVRKDLVFLGFDLDSSIDIITASSLTLISLTNILKWRHVSNNSSNISSNPDNLSSKYISRKSYNNMLNEASDIKPVVSATHFGIIGNVNLYNYLRNSICKKYRNAHLYYIEDCINPSRKLDYIVVGSVNIDNNLDKIIENSVRWFQKNNTASVILAHSDIMPENRKSVKYINPIPLINKIDELGKSLDKDFEMPSDKIAVGKPYCSEFIDKFIERYDLKKEEKLPILVIGDDYNADMKFAFSANCDKCLVLSGNTQISDIESKKINTDDIEFVVPDVSYLGL